MDLKCGECGSTLDDHDRFCRACGRPVPEATPPSQPEPRSPTPHPATSRPAGPDRTAGSWLPTIAAVAILAVGVAAWFAITGTGSDAAPENAVYLEPAGVVGAPFTPSIAASPATDDVGPTTTLEAGAVEMRSVKGSDEMVYTAAPGRASCRSSQLVDYLDTEPRTATAWAAAQGIEPDEIGRFVDTLTPMELGRDVRATISVLTGSGTESRQVLLQRGTAVLVAPSGEPRVRCVSGAPLGAPEPVATPVYVGLGWPGFDPGNVAHLTPCDEPLTRFVLQDSTTGRPFVRPIGASDGEISDIVAAPSTTTTTTAPIAGSTSTTSAPATTIAPTTTTTTTAPTTTTTTLPVPNHDATNEGTVAVSSRLCGSYAATKATDGDVATSWISSSGDGAYSTFVWTAHQDEYIGSVTIVSNAANARRSTGHGFAAVTVQVLDAADTVVFEERVDLPGTPDPDASVAPHVTGRKVRLLLEGHENPKGSGFAELTVMVVR